MKNKYLMLVVLPALLGQISSASEIKCETQANANNQIGKLVSLTKESREGTYRFLSYQVVDKSTGFEYTKPSNFRFTDVNSDAVFLRISSARPISGRQNPSNTQVRFQSLKLSVNKLTGEASFLFDSGQPSKIKCEPISTF